MDIAQRLSALMKERAISSYRLAKDVGVRTSTVTGWLEGRTPQLGHAKKVADYFNVDMGWLTGEQSVLSDTLPGTIKNAPSREAEDEISEARRKVYELIESAPEEALPLLHDTAEAIVRNSGKAQPK